MTCPPLSLTIRDMPPGINQLGKLKSRHWAVYMRARDDWRLLVRAAIGRNMTEFPGRVRVTYTAYRVHLMDQDNHYGSFKLIGDALVHYGTTG